MSIIRAQHNKNFVIINKICLQDDRLSWKAKGIYAYLMSLPDNWLIKTNEVVKHSTEGKTSLLSGLKELLEYGYCEHIINRDENGCVKSRDYLIKEPTQLDLENLDQVNLDIDNQPLLSNNINNNELIKKLNKTNVLLEKTEKFKKRTAKKKSNKKFNPESPGGEIAQYFLDEIEKYNPAFITPNMAAWESAFNGMIYVKGYPYNEIKDIIWFAQHDSFWKPIIINPYALKAKYETLKIRLMQFKEKECNENSKKNVFEEAKELHRKRMLLKK